MMQKVRRAGDARAFARNLHRLRIATPALSQRKLAEELGVSRSCYARYELGQRMPPAWFAAKAAAYFHTSMEQLFSEGVSDKSKVLENSLKSGECKARNRRNT